MSRRSAAILAIAFAAVAIGAFREYIFLNLNYQLDHLARNTPYSYAHSRFQAQVAGMDLPQLIRLKWILAVASVILSLLLALLLARVLFGDGRYTRTIISGFVIIGCLSFILSWLSVGDDKLYHVSVKLLHALQYPVILIFIWGGYQLGQVLQRR